MIPPKPFTGSKPWALILGKFSDHPEEPQAPQFFTDFVTRGTGGINDYFNDVSYGNINMDGSRVFGWFNLPYTQSVDAARGRWDRVMSAINAVASRVDFRPFYGIAVMLNAPVDSGGFSGPGTLTLNGATKPYGLVVLDNLAWGNTWAAQEMSHGFSLDHSWSANPDTEYGNPFDVMSAFTNNYGFTHPRFAVSGPGFNAPNLDLFGWIPAARVWQSNHSDVLTLTALNHPQNGGYLMAKMSSGSRDYTVELRCKDGWDRAIPQHAIVIHEVRPDGKNYVIQNAAASRFHWLPGEALTTVQPTLMNPSGERIEVVSIDSVHCTAVVSIVQHSKSTIKDLVDNHKFIQKEIVKEVAKEVAFDGPKAMSFEGIDPFRGRIYEQEVIRGLAASLDGVQARLASLEKQVQQQRAPFIRSADLPPVGKQIIDHARKEKKNKE
jgi:hypothetical protein